ncbi:hypothetical protein B0J14DRAFT_361773 [Halenospora varia]|nr:hypothetical protein B0J14DRAFT_361773 [Halenospora varia]
MGQPSMKVALYGKACALRPPTSRFSSKYSLSCHHPFHNGHQKRIDNFQGTDPEYIIYLETKVKQLTQACSPPSSPTSVVGDEPIYNPPECAPVPGLRFLPYEPDSLRFVNEFGTPPRSANKPDSLSRLSKRRRKSTARWQNEMDDICATFQAPKTGHQSGNVLDSRPKRNFFSHSTRLLVVPYNRRSLLPLNPIPSYVSIG